MVVVWDAFSADGLHARSVCYDVLGTLFNELCTMSTSSVLSRATDFCAYCKWYILRRSREISLLYHCAVSVRWLLPGHQKGEQSRPEVCSIRCHACKKQYVAIDALPLPLGSQVHRGTSPCAMIGLRSMVFRRVRSDRRRRTGGRGPHTVQSCCHALKNLCHRKRILSPKGIEMETFV